MPARNKLTDKAVKSALKQAAEAASEVRISDGDGLRLDCQPHGKGWWRLRYRFGGRQSMLSVGTYPPVTLAQARLRRDEALAQIAGGTDPSDVRKAEKAARVQIDHIDRLMAAGKPLPGTFEAVAREWLTEIHEKDTVPSHAARTLARFEQMAFPYLGARPLSSIDAPALLAVLRRVVDRGNIETAHRLKGACSQVFRYGISTGVCSRDPAADLRGALPAPPARHLAAVTDPAQAGELLRAMSSYHGDQITHAALALSALTFLRPGELRQLEWAWVNLDEAVIEVPSALMKKRKADKVNGPRHIVPLAPQAVVLLRDLDLLTGDGRYLFPSLLTEDRPMSENTVNTALRRMGFDRETATAHGFRAMARTLIAERLNIEAHVIEAQLAHAVAGPLGRAYDRTQFLEQRRDMMNRWADYIDALRAQHK